MNTKTKLTIYNQVLNRLETDFFHFPAGEVGIRIEEDNIRFNAETKELYVEAHITDSEDVMTLLQTKDALDRIFHNIPMYLLLPYIPYGRQDRVCVPGEAHSLKVFANLINALKFDHVVTVDPHSTVTEALIDNLLVVRQKDIFDSWSHLRLHCGAHQFRFLSPDTGANKKTEQVAGYFQHSSFIQADKVRDLETGKILKTVIHASQDEISGSKIMIVDDICDGGRTFIEIAKELKKMNASQVYLFVTHGVFSQGLALLQESGIDRIYTTDSYTTLLDTSGYDNYLCTFPVSTMMLCKLKNKHYILQQGQDEITTTKCH